MRADTWIMLSNSGSDMGTRMVGGYVDYVIESWQAVMSKWGPAATC